MEFLAELRLTMKFLSRLLSGSWRVGPSGIVHMAQRVSVWWSWKKSQEW